MRLTLIESVLNRNIAANTAARALSKRLAGKCLAMDVNVGTNNTLVTLRLACDGERVSLSADSPDTVTDEPHARLQGTPLSYLSMLRAEAESALRTGQVRIEGDAEVAQAFRNLLKHAGPELEEELARIIGDVPAHQLSRLARGTLSFGQRMIESFAQSASEFLQEESRDLATRTEVEEFVAEVDQVRDAVDRLEARLIQLTQSFSRR